MSIALLNPFILETPIAGFVRTIFDSGVTTAPTEISTTQTAHASISTTESSGDRFAVFWQSIIQHNSTAADAIAILFESPTEIQRYNVESQDVTDQFSLGGAYAYSGGSARTLSVDSDEETSGAGNEIQDYGLCALKLEPLTTISGTVVSGDAFNHSAAQSDSTSTTYATKASINLGAGDWLIVASASLAQSAAGVTKVRVFDGTTALTEQSGTLYAQDTTGWIPFNFVGKVSPTTSTTYSLQNARVGATGTARIRQATILALDLSKFDNNYYAEQLTAQTTTTTTAFGGTGLSSTFTIANPSNYHLVIGTAICGSSATNRSTRARLFNTTDSTTYSGETRREANATAERYDIFSARIVTFNAASQTIAWQHSISAPGTSTIDEMAIAVLDLGYAPPPPANPVFQSAETAIGVGNTITVTKPASIAIDDLLIAAIAVEKGTGETITATGWTLIRRENQTTNVGIGIYYKVAVSGDTGAGSFSFTLANGSKWSAAVMRITDYDTTTPIAGNNGQNGAATTAHVAPAITGSIPADALVLSFYAGKAQGTYTPAASTTEMYDRPNTTDGQPAHMGAYEVQASTGNTTGRTATCATSTEYAGVQIAINPVP